MSRKIINAVVTSALTLGVVAATADSASANSDWAAQIGPPGQGCYAWSTYGNNYVTGHVYSQSGHDCMIEVEQEYNGDYNGQNINYACAAGTVASTVPFYYGGPERDFIYARDLTLGTPWQAISQLYTG